MIEATALILSVLVFIFCLCFSIASLSTRFADTLVDKLGLSKKRWGLILGCNFLVSVAAVFSLILLLDVLTWTADYW